MGNAPDFMARRLHIRAIAALVLLPLAAGWLRGAAAARALAQARACCLWACVLCHSVIGDHNKF
jgi:cytochrome c553